MRNGGRNGGTGGALVPRQGKGSYGIIPNSFKALSSYLKIVSSGASTVASTVRSAASAASAIVERDCETKQDQNLIHDLLNFIERKAFALHLGEVGSWEVEFIASLFTRNGLDDMQYSCPLNLICSVVSFPVSVVIIEILGTSCVGLVGPGDYQKEVSWAGFDKLELEGGITRQVLLLGFSYGFQVWDVEVADNVYNIVSRHDGAVSFMQMLPKPMVSKQSADKFADSHPLLIICADGSFSGGNNIQEGSGIPCSGSNKQCQESLNPSCVPTSVWFYSLRSQSYVHLLRFRSVVHLVRCSSRVVAVLQSSQIHCFDAASLEREYTVLTNPVATGSYGSGSIGFGPLAVGPRWMAYSGSPVVISNFGHVSPQCLNPSTSFPCPSSHGNLVAHYAKESSKQLAAGIVTLGDMGYKKLSRYYSELLPEGNHCQSGTTHEKVHGVANGHLTDADSVGMLTFVGTTINQVIVRDIVGKTVIAQFRAHKSPILLLCFDPSGTLLVTASVQGHTVNVFRIMPELSGGSSEATSGPSYVHLYRLQRGFTNAVIQDISFSSDSQWIMISSLRGTSHLFAISPSGGLLLRSAVSRIKNGSNGWRNTVSGAAAAATGRMSSLSGVITSVFCNCKGNDISADNNSMKKNYYLLVFSPAGCVTQYALRISSAYNGSMSLPGASAACEFGIDGDARLMVEPIQKWNICQKQNCKERENNVDLNEEKISVEEKNQMYISEAELQMHQNRNPLWARSEIYFQSMLIDDSIMDKEGACNGETEIERVPIHMLEARSEDLVPVFDYIYAPKYQRGRTSAMNDNNSGQFECQGLMHLGMVGLPPYQTVLP
ncbi:UNVERIFIED_CONTAM: Autophagy-related protein 18f [Sesamum calycinum]|uniref:Autophagy-related protein 18f n=1 Tax=Sesamum calycinum TaxID=2727403 RepID=A0AAW2Q4U9_9LAMI